MGSRSRRLGGWRNSLNQHGQGRDVYKRQTQDYLVENGGIVITNPNAPTGIYKPLDQIEEIIKANQSVVVIIDEAYINSVSYTHLA